MEEKHKEIALAVCEFLKGCEYEAFACTTSHVYHYSFGNRPCAACMRVHVHVADSALLAMRELKDAIEDDDDDFLYWDCIDRDQVFSGFCGEADSVESLQEWLEREPELAEELDMSVEPEEEEEAEEEEE